ncbi:MAG TPA: efflux RND transporter periplasmic adaptor subunit [Candidatus Acidoferrum sp.]|nr:efflux RND transporter periplasmic adaptor subunit [Candidatus Acidoferrum sp.]
MTSRTGRLRRISPRTKLLLSSLPFAVALFVFAGCAKKEPEVVPEVSVQVTAAKKGDVSRIVAAEAVVFPLQQAVITPKISSTIKSFAVQRGARVRKGQLLAVLENADLSAAATQSKGEYEQAEGAYVTSTASSIPEQIQKAELDASSFKAAADAQKQVAESRKELFQQGALPRRELDAAEVALAQEQSQYQQAQKVLDDLRRSGKEQAVKSAGGQFNAAKGKLLASQAALSYSYIKSPINGVVTDRPLYPGELATANQPLLTVMDNSSLIAKAHISQAQAVGLKKGAEAEVRIAGQDDAIAGKLSLVSPALDPGSTTIEVWVQAAKPPDSLRPGMTVEISITAATVEDAVIVPNNSIFQTNDGANYVVVAGSDNLAHQTTVQLGIRGVTETQITSGVNAGESVITSGGYGLPDKTKIKIEAPEKNEDADTAGDKSDRKTADSSDGKTADKSGKKTAGKSKSSGTEKE